MRAYIAGPLFTKGEREFCRRVKAVAQAAGFEALWPWELTDQTKVNGDKNGNKLIFDKNVEAIDRSDVMVAILDGPDVDSGTSWEIGYSFSREKPVIGIRTDFRNAGDNSHAKVNLMIDQVVHAFVRTEEELAEELKKLKGGIESQEKLDGFIKG